MKVIQTSPIFRMKFCYVRLAIYKKSGVTRSLRQWYKLRSYEQRQKARPDPTLLHPTWLNQGIKKIG